MPFASAAGPRNSGSDSIELHSETQHPQLMQSASLWITSNSSGATRNSLPSGGSAYPGWRYGFIARIFCQKGSMSTTRSLMIGRFPIAETTGTWPASTYGLIRSLQASTARPSMRMPHEPQIIIRQLFRNASVPSCWSLMMSRTSSRFAQSGASHS